jgi:aminoglycoside phosphotransferase (APT) family kinase protein
MSAGDSPRDLHLDEPPWPAIAEKVGVITRVARAGFSRSTFVLSTTRGEVAVKRMSADHDPAQHLDLIEQISRPPYRFCPRALGAVTVDATRWYALFEWLGGGHRLQSHDSADLLWCSALDLLERMRDCAVVPERRLESIWLSRLEAHFSADATASALLAALSRSVPEGPRTLAHGDFSVQNLVWGWGGFVLVDWEEVGSAPPGFDAGWMLALARMGHGPQVDHREMQEAFLKAGFPRSNLIWFEALGLLRLFFRTRTLPMAEGLRRMVVVALARAVSECATRMGLSPCGSIKEA